MKTKILVGAVSLMIAAGSLVGCNAMKQGVDEVMPTDMPSAPATAGTATDKPSQKPTSDPSMGAEASPSASSSSTPGTDNAGK